MSIKKVKVLLILFVMVFLFYFIDRDNSNSKFKLPLLVSVSDKAKTDELNVNHLAHQRHMKRDAELAEERQSLSGETSNFDTGDSGSKIFLENSKCEDMFSEEEVQSNEGCESKKPSRPREIITWIDIKSHNSIYNGIFIDLAQQRLEKDAYLQHDKEYFQWRLSYERMMYYLLLDVKRSQRLAINALWWNVLRYLEPTKDLVEALAWYYVGVYLGVIDSERENDKAVLNFSSREVLESFRGTGSFY